MAKFRNRRVVILVAGVIVLFCCGLLAFGFYLNNTPEGQADATVRAQEREATREERTAIAMAEATEEARPTNTPKPTSTPEPSATAIPEPSATNTPSSLTSEQAVVIDVIDGDTIDVEMGGETFRVRYIGIDTPERGEPLYTEATNSNAGLVTGKTVILQKDISETDTFGRLLRYVYLSDGTFVNAELVRRGYAEAVAYPPDDSKHDELITLQQQAIDADLGLWGQPVSEPLTEPPTVISGPYVIIVSVNKDAEYVDLRNDGDQPQDLSGWVLRSEKGAPQQDCSLVGIVQPDETLRVWARAADSQQGGYNCNFEDNIWNNAEPDPAVLINNAGQEVSRR